MRKHTRINFAIKSRIGKRDVNQDALVCSFNMNDEFCAVVCDGVGSVKGSQYASNIVANTFADEFEKLHKLTKPTEWFRKTLDLALTRVKNCSIIRKLPGISTTLALLIICNKHYYCFNIGDTRVYKISKDNVKQISYDHIYKNYLKDKDVKVDERKLFALTNFIDGDNPKSAVFALNDGIIDSKCMFVLCTDGVYKVLKNQDIYNATWAKKGLPLVLRSSLLNHKAIAKESNDNLSNVLIMVK